MWFASISTAWRAISAKDIGALMAHYTPDVVVFDVGPPTQCLGADAYQKNFERWFASTQGPIGFEMSDFRAAVRDDVAFGHYLAHVKSKRTSGEAAARLGGL